MNVLFEINDLRKRTFLFDFSIANQTQYLSAFGSNLAENNIDYDYSYDYLLMSLELEYNTEMKGFQINATFEGEIKLNVIFDTIKYFY